MQSRTQKFKITSKYFNSNSEPNGKSKDSKTFDFLAFSQQPNMEKRKSCTEPKWRMIDEISETERAEKERWRGDIIIIIIYLLLIPKKKI